MGVWIPWLADAARLTGHPVVEVSGWRSRGTGGDDGAMDAVECVVLHHTAGRATGEMPSLGVIRDGRAGLSGPLSHYGLGRSGTVYVIAAGACNHAGVSAWAGISSLNSRAIGIEAESVGDGRDWTPAQLDCYPRLVAACLHYMRRDAARAAGHREVALPLGRKIDPAGIDMPELRRRVAWLLADPLNRIPRGRPSGGALMALTDDEQRELLDAVRAIRDLRMDLPDDARHPGTLANAVISTWAQVFFGSREFGPALADRPVVAPAALADAVAQRLAGPIAAAGLSVADVKAAVTAALDEGLVRVDVSVQGRPPA